LKTVSCSGPVTVWSELRRFFWRLLNCGDGLPRRLAGKRYVYFFVSLQNLLSSFGSTCF